MRGVPRGPDWGINRTIDEDRLGLSQIYIQAKRFSDNSVGRPYIDAFVGAMIRGGCKKVFLLLAAPFQEMHEKVRMSLESKN